MKPVIKIDLKREDLMVENDRPYIYIIKEPKKIKFGDPKSIAKNCLEKVCYNIYEVYDPRKGFLYYALEDKSIFEHLFCIAETELKTRLDQSRELGRSYGHQEGFKCGVKQTTDKFRKLPWWKRLFGEF